MGVSGGANATVVEESGVGGGAGGDVDPTVVDDVFEDAITINEEDTRDIGVGGATSVEVQLDVGGAGAVETDAKVEGLSDNNIVGGAGGVTEEFSAVNNVDVEGGVIVDGGAEEMVGEKAKGGDEDNDMGGIYGMEEVRIGGVSGEGGEGDATASGSVEGSVIEPIHHIPVWRLREILAHAEGDYMLLV